MEPFDTQAIRLAYNTVAGDYVTAFADDLEGLPLDRSILDRADRQVAPDGLVLDLGCGPGQVAHHFADRGRRVVGLDLASEMLARAAERTPAAAFVCGDMAALPFRSGSFGLVVAFYSVQHLSRPGLQRAVGEMHRLLIPNGTLVLATHLGDGEVFIDEFLDHRIETIGGILYTDDELREVLRSGLFELDDVRHRSPLAHEYPSRRIYVIARARAAST